MRSMIASSSSSDGSFARGLLAMPALPDPLLLAIGKLTVNFSAFEAYVYVAFCVITGDRGPLARATLSKVDSISIKLSMVFDIAELHKEKQPMAEALLSHRSAIWEIVAFRNKIAHSLFLIADKTSEVTIATNLFRETRGAKKQTPITAAAITKMSLRIYDIIRALSPHIPKSEAVLNLPLPSPS